MRTHLRIDTAQHVASRPSTTYVGDWELLDLIGQGTWSLVHAARPRHSAAAVPPVDYVVKIARGTDAAGRAWLAREAAVGASVSHQHLIAVLSADVDGPTPYLVMPFLHGATLREASSRCGPLAAPQALWVVRQVATALAAVHEAGWIHADVKPSNILVSPLGHATLIDLGLALRAGSAECAPGAPFRGTVAYAAPERISRLRETTPHADTYSLGATLYELLTGRPPFEDLDPEQVMAAHLQRSVPNPRRWRPGLDHGVTRLLRDMLAKDPLRRPSAAELVARLVEREIAALWERAA